MFMNSVGQPTNGQPTNGQPNNGQPYNGQSSNGQPEQSSCWIQDTNDIAAFASYLLKIRSLQFLIPHKII